MRYKGLQPGVHDHGVAALQPSAHGVAGLVAASLAGTGALGSGVLPAAAWQLAGEDRRVVSPSDLVGVRARVRVRASFKVYRG